MLFAVALLAAVLAENASGAESTHVVLSVGTLVALILAAAKVIGDMRSQRTEIKALQECVHELRSSCSKVGDIEVKVDSLWKLNDKIGSIELKANTVWEHIMRHALDAGLKKGELTQNSPVQPAPELMAQFSDSATCEPGSTATLAEDLRRAYAAEWRGLPLGELTLAIERKFGARVIRVTCSPSGAPNGSGLLAAAAVAAGDANIDVSALLADAPASVFGATAAAAVAPKTDAVSAPGAGKSP